MVNQAYRIKNRLPEKLRRLYAKITEVIRLEKGRDRSVPDGSDKHRHSRHWQLALVVNICVGHRWLT